MMTGKRRAEGFVKLYKGRRVRSAWHYWGAREDREGVVIGSLTDLTGDNDPYGVDVKLDNGKEIWFQPEELELADDPEPTIYNLQDERKSLLFEIDMLDGRIARIEAEKKKCDTTDTTG